MKAGRSGQSPIACVSLSTLLRRVPLSQKGEDRCAQNFHFAVQASASFTMSGRFIVPARIALSKLRFT